MCHVEVIVNSRPITAISSDVSDPEPLIAGFGMIITDPEHWRLRLKLRDYHGIIAQRPPYKSHNAKRAWFVLDFDVIMQWVYWL